MPGELIAVTSAHLDEDRISYWRTGAVATGDTYIGALQRAGLTPVVIPVIGSPAPKELLAPFAGLVLVGGGDVESWRYGEEPHERSYGQAAERDEIELGLLEVAVQRNIPVLGICRGAQLVNVAAGGTLIQHLPFVTDLVHCRKDQAAAPVHTVSVLAGSRLAAATGSDLLGVNSLHHQAVGTVGAGLRPTGWAEDGTVEAVEGVDGRRVLGVQWHPELLVGAAAHAALFAWLVTEAGRPVVVPVIDTVQVMDTVPVMEALAVMDTVPVLDVLAVAEAVPAATVVGVEPVVTAPVAPVPALASAAA